MQRWECNEIGYSFDGSDFRPVDQGRWLDDHTHNRIGGAKRTLI